jgi:dienelactone hydrolase
MLQIQTTLPGSNNKSMALDIMFDETKGKCPVIIYAHGFNGFKDWGNFDLIAKQFVAAGFTFVKFNFSHNGTTPDHLQDFADLEAFGENNYTKQLYDLRQVTDWVSDPDNAYAGNIDADHIGLIGHSMGGGISIIQTAEDKRVKALVTWASISQCKTPWGNWPEEKMKTWKESGVQYYTNGRTKQEMPLRYQLFEDYEHNAERLNILQAAKNIEVPFLICHGTEDTGVSVQSAKDLHAANPTSKLLIIGSDHVFGRKHPWTKSDLPEAMQKVIDKNIDFFRQHINA